MGRSSLESAPSTESHPIPQTQQLPGSALKDMIEADPYYGRYKDLVDFEELAKAAIAGQYKVGFTNLSNTGIVIAGFGDKDYFPRLISYRCNRLVLGKLIFSEETQKAQTISQKNGSAFVSFAQDDMINAFVFGAGDSAIQEVENQFNKAIDGFCDGLVSAGIVPDLSADAAKTAALGQLKEKINESFGEAFTNHLLESHARPMRNIIGSLPFDELAELAEILVLLESMKERVTSSRSSVSGPIDVAVISKNDGFIWIKRKHYFVGREEPASH
jgi:hypothetical protein